MRINKLTTIQVRNATLRPKEDGEIPDATYYGDGGGLWLRVTATSASWVFRYKVARKGREFGLGSAATYSLFEARKRARDCRKMRDDGVDPIAVKQQKTLAARVASAKLTTFKQAAEQYIADHKSEWTNSKHIDQWRNTLRDYCYPVFGDLPVEDIDLDLVLKVLRPIWETKRVTAERVRGRIERVLSHATTSKLRSGANPAIWRDNLQNILAGRPNNGDTPHQLMMPVADVPAFVAKLLAYRDAPPVEGKEDPGPPAAASALAFTVMCAARTGEALGCAWSEIDIDRDDVWVIPGNRMKGRLPHTVALNDATIAILRQRQQHRQAGCDLVFHEGGRRLPEAAMRLLLHSLGGKDASVHGFRASYSTWCSKQGADFQVREATLAHKPKDRVAAAYDHNDLLDRKGKLLEDWARFLTASEAAEKVVKLRRRG